VAVFLLALAAFLEASVPPRNPALLGLLLGDSHVPEGTLLLALLAVWAALGLFPLPVLE
jgi:hypothetical protein